VCAGEQGADGPAGEAGGGREGAATVPRNQTGQCGQDQCAGGSREWKNSEGASEGARVGASPVESERMVLGLY
jgi:hypothetical protein